VHRSRSSWLIFALLTAACSKTREDVPTTNAPTTSAVVVNPSAAAPSAPPPLIEPNADHVGGVIARVPGTDGVYIADEDHGNLRFIADTSPLLDPTAKPAQATPQEVPDVAKSATTPKPYSSNLTPASSASAISLAKSAAPEVKPPPAAVAADGATEVTQQVLALGGAPANLIAIRDGVLVTIRDPGKLVRIRKDDQGQLSVAHEVALAADAWGLALNPSGTRALVTSAWTNTVTLVEVTDAGLKKCGEVTVGREPRGIAFLSDKVAYVNHLVGNEITRLELGSACDGSGIAEAKAIVVAPSPLRTHVGKTLSASLGYALALSPDKRRLFIPRHALGARSHSSWFGAPTVDTLLLPDEKLAAPMHESTGAKYDATDKHGMYETEYSDEPTESWTAFVQPRDIRFRRSTNTVLVASEGGDRLVELDALAMDPSQAIVALHELSDWFRRAREEPMPNGLQPVRLPLRDPYTDPSGANPSGNKSCAAPQGLVLDAKETAAFVYCRASSTLVRMRLHASVEAEERLKTVGLSWAKLDKDAGGKENLNLGRRLFYSVTMAEGMGCAGCHPEGRDDGHVWIEAKRQFGFGPVPRFLGGHFIKGIPSKPDGVPRRTPMLVGRVFPVGPYGWRGESETLEKRIMAGTQLHSGEIPANVPEYYVNALGIFLRKGLVKPPVVKKELSDEEKKGKAIFEDSKTACAVCHEPTRYFSNYTAMKLPPLRTLPGFEEEEDALFKTPSLLYVSHHGSMLHDGSAKTLEDLIETNGTRMGNTSHLSAGDRKALVAYLKTL
jgi:mono/diheme cytochrome c family protein